MQIMDMCWQQKYLSAVASVVGELEQAHHQLWTLLIVRAIDALRSFQPFDARLNGVLQCNVISCSFQLLVDVYVTYGVVGKKTCNSMFFEDGAGPLEQTLRLIISMISYLLPNWATIYVFFLYPRFQFTTSMDLPDLARDETEEMDETTYELLSDYRNSAVVV